MNYRFGTPVILVASGILAGCLLSITSVVVLSVIALLVVVWALTLKHTNSADAIPTAFVMAAGFFGSVLFAVPMWITVFIVDYDKVVPHLSSVWHWFGQHLVR